MEEQKTEGTSELVDYRLADIPFIALAAIGRRFVKGEDRPDYGRDNWKKGGRVYLADRLEHAITHLMQWANGDRSEDHLAAVAWFCCIMMWHEGNTLTANGDLMIVAKPQAWHIALDAFSRRQLPFSASEAYESLKARGYEVTPILVAEHLQTSGAYMMASYDGIDLIHYCRKVS